MAPIEIVGTTCRPVENSQPAVRGEIVKRGLSSYSVKVVICYTDQSVKMVCERYQREKRSTGIGQRASCLVLNSKE